MLRAGRKREREREREVKRRRKIITRKWENGKEVYLTAAQT
jgi:hypothetical protein